LKQVVHLPVNVLEGEGPELKEIYDVGSTYPVFILTNSEGEIITRWTGYSTAGQFVYKLNASLKDLRTIKERRAQFEANPTLQEALALGRFYAEIGEHLEAVSMFRRAEKLSGQRKVSLHNDIFKNMAEAVWKEMAPYDSIYPAAEYVLASEDAAGIIKMATLMSRLSRKFDHTDNLGKYLDAGIQAASASNNPKDTEDRYLLVAEHALQIAHDTAKAIEIKEMSMGNGWETNPNKFYGYAKWCLEREVNLGAAEMYARQAVQVAGNPEMKARVLNTLSEIYEARGNYEGAIGAIQMAIENHPENPYYQTRLDDIEDAMAGGQ
jgi:tetratricopeptide (TPR) repeat protein